MSEGSIGTVRAARSGMSLRATQVGYTALAWARLFAAAYIHWAFGGTVLLGENSGQSAGILFDQDPLSYVIGWQYRFPTWFMHRGYHLSRVPTLGHEARVAAYWTMALLFGREVVSLGQVEHPRWEWESAGLRRHLARVRSKLRARGWARKAQGDMAENKSARPYTERRRS